MSTTKIALLVVLGLITTGTIAFMSAVTPLPQNYLEVGEEIVANEAYAAPISESNEILLEMFSELALPGVSISVGVDGEVVWSRTAGYADLNSQTPLSTETSMRIGSVSKSITSLAVAKLLEQGLLDLDAPIENYGVQFPSKAFPITARHLATHTAGIRHYKPGIGPLPSSEMLSNEHYDSVSESLSIFQDSPLLFQPGTDFSYSTYGYTLLSAAIEAVSGSTFVDYIQDEVLSQLQMTHTTPEFKFDLGVEQASYYVSMFGKLMEAPESDHSNKWAGGGLLSTPSDLVSMGNNLLFGDFLRDDTLELLFTPQPLSNGEINEQNYGIGWRIDEFNLVESDDSVTTLLAYHHGGTSNGANAFLILFPEQSVVVAIATNGHPWDQSEFRSAAFWIAKAFIDFRAAR